MNYLKQKLEEKNMSQSELARRIGTTHATINAICNNRFKRGPNAMLVYDICQILDLNIKEFIEEIIK